MNKKIIVVGILVGALALGGIFATAFAGTRAPKAPANNAEMHYGVRGGNGQFENGTGIQFGMKNGEHRGEMVEKLANYLGISQDELRNELKSGKTLAEVAKENGKSTNDLVNFFMSEAKEHLQTALKNGHITQQRYDEVMQNIKQRVEQMINGKMPPKGFGMHGVNEGKGFFGRMHGNHCGKHAHDGEHAPQKP